MSPPGGAATDWLTLADNEGSFLLCGFLVSLAGVARANPHGLRAAQLFSEEYDVAQHQMRGNVPQAFVHAMLLETAFRLWGKDEAHPADVR